VGGWCPIPRGKSPKKPGKEGKKARQTRKALTPYPFPKKGGLLPPVNYPDIPVMLFPILPQGFSGETFDSLLNIDNNPLPYLGNCGG
jgi:hypothetical protein